MGRMGIDVPDVKGQKSAAIGWLPAIVYPAHRLTAFTFR
jgi:hypothetical protein